MWQPCRENARLPLTSQGSTHPLSPFARRAGQKSRPEEPPPAAADRRAATVERGNEDGDVAYGWLHRSIETLIKLPILPFADAAADAFHRLRDARVRAGTMDLKIAAICMAHDATLLTRNLVDFDKVPGLRVENWLD